MINSNPHSVIGSTFSLVVAEKKIDDSESADIAKAIKVHNTPSTMPLAPCPRSSLDNAEPLTIIKSYFLAASSGEKNFTSAHAKYPVATFGLEKKRLELANLVREIGLENSTSIDRYNKKIGITFQNSEWKSCGISEEEVFFTRVKNIVEIVASLPEKASSKSLKRKYCAWANYLYDNKEKLDPIIRIKTLLTQTVGNGNKDNLEQFIIKNSKADANLEEMQIHFRYLIMELGCTNSAEVQQALLSYYNQKRESLLSPANYLDMAHLFNFHFFRNTSKLGLEFFASRGYDITFAWNTKEDNKFNLAEVMDTPWKRGVKRYGIHELITLSEIRSILRDKKGLYNSNNVFKIFFTNFDAEMALSLTAEKWVNLE